MAEFEAVVPGRLWQVRNLLTAEQTDHIVSVDWISLPWVVSPQQSAWSRREIAWDCAATQALKGYIDQQLDTINSAAGTSFVHASGHFWVDLPGFACAMHTDGHLANALQMYWIVPSEAYGTGFYHYRRSDSLMYQFASRPNTGYLMLNHPNPDGSQPLQWHAMLNPVPEGTIRVTSYWQFS